MHVSFRAFLIAAALAGSAASTCLAQVPSQKQGDSKTSTSMPRHSASKLTELITIPTNTRELLRNFKLSYDMSLLVQPEFFDQKVLVKFFDAKGVRWTTSGYNESGSFHEALISLRGPWSSADISARTVTFFYPPCFGVACADSTQRRFGRISIKGIADPAFTAALVMEVFGTTTIQDAPSIISMASAGATSVRAAPTARGREPMRRLFYSSVRASINYVAVFGLGEDDLIRSVLVEEREF